MPQFERKSEPFAINGIDLNHPIDLLPNGKWPILENVRSYQVGRLEPRAGIQAINSTAIPDANIHSSVRVLDTIAGATVPLTRIVGAGPSLYAGLTSLTQYDTGYTGNPLSLIPYRPDQSPEPWCYVYDFNRMRKIRSDGLNYQVGIAAPNTAPTLVLDQPNWANVDAPLYGTPIASYIAGGTIAQASVVVGNRASVATTVNAIVYDSGTSGWAVIAPSNATKDYTFMGELAEFWIDSELAQMVEIHPALAATTVTNIWYDTGGTAGTGLCTVQPAGSWTGLRTNALIAFPGMGYSRVLSVTVAPDGSYSFRCSIPFNVPAGQAIEYPACFRAYVSPHAVGANLHYPTVAATCTGAGEGTLSVTKTLDLTKMNGRAVQREDYLHISVLVDKLENVIQGKVFFDVDSATNDFTKNYYFKAFRPNDFVPVTVNEATVEAARQVAIQRQITDLAQNPSVYPSGPAPNQSPRRQSYSLPPITRTRDPWPPSGEETSQPPDNYIASPPDLNTRSDQTTTGSLQWTEFIFHMSEFIRVGADYSRTLADIKAIRFALTCSETTNFQLGGINVTGTFGPDQGINQNELIYRYRYRSSITGAHSRPGPATRAGVLARRQQVLVTPTPSTDPQVDLIDIERFGGTLSNWHYVGSKPNDSAIYYDKIDDLSAAQNEALDINAFEPWPQVDPPFSATVTAVGTRVIRNAGGFFNLKWAAGTPIRINGTVYTLYASPIDAATLDLVESAGSQLSVLMNIDEPVVVGVPLPYAWGPSNGFIYATGSTRQPGVVRFCSANDPDSAPEQYWIELTPPSEPLQGGLLFDGRSFVASNQRWFDLRPTGNFDMPLVAQELPIDRGLASPFALCVGGGRIWFLSQDGLYWTTGGPATSFTEKDLRPIFPHGDKPGVVTNGFYPPDFTDKRKLRLSWIASWVYFDYKDTNGTMRSLAYNTTLDEWWPDQYTPGVNLHVDESTSPSLPVTVLCGTDGRLYTPGGLADGAAAIACHARTESKNFDDIRAEKLFGDLFLDGDTQSIPVTITAGFNQYTDLLPPVTINTASRLERAYDLLNGLGKLSRDIALDFSWSSATAAPKFYNWECTLVNKPEFSLKRATDWDNAGTPSSKYIRAALIEANTSGVARTLTFLKDEGADSGNSITVNHSTQTTFPYALTPFTTHMLRAYPVDAGQWELFNITYVYDVYPETYAPGTGIGGNGSASPWTDLGYKGDKWIQGVRLKADTADTVIPVLIEGDSEVLYESLSVQHKGQTIKPYSWVPFVSHMVRTISRARVWDPPESEFIWEPMPELTTHWYTQPTTHDNHGWNTIGWFYLAYMSLGAFNFQIANESGQTSQWSIPSSGGDLIYRKLYFTEASLIAGYWPLKGRSFTYAIAANPDAKCRIFQKDCEVAIKQWGSEAAFEVKNPFGDASRAIGARI